jgi:hypothetical protein
MNNHKLLAWHIEEPYLLFGGNQRSVDPRSGIATFGPYYLPEQGQPSPSEIRLGVIGDGETIALTRHWLEMCRNPIESPKENLYLFPSFPGFQKDATFRCELLTSNSLIESISEHEINAIVDIPNVNIRIRKAVELFITKLRLIIAREPRPQVIVCALPQKIDEYCGISRRTRGAKRPKLTTVEKQILTYQEYGQQFLSDFGIGQPVEIEERAYDLRRALKTRTMQYNTPIQILRYSTLMGRRGLEDEATRAWNFCLGLYYKAGGFPWRLADFNPNTCYVGISFYKEKDTLNQNLRTSVAQIFTTYGQGLVLKGGDAQIDEKFDRTPHLNEAGAYAILRQCIELYEQQVKRKPGRIVIHKTSRYSDKERKGFQLASRKIGQLTLVAFGNRGIRFFRNGKYPPLRGTLTQLPDKSLIFYTHGYTPYLKTYPGPRIPRPLDILEIHGTDDIIIIAKEILSLTKMNWNSAKFSIALPITIAFAKEVGSILSELPLGGNIQQQYRFYM